MSYPVPLPPGYAPGKSLGSAPPYGAPPAFPAMQGCIPVMMPHAMMPQHHYTSSFPLALPTTPSSPPVGFAAPGEPPGALAAPKPVEGTHHQQEAHQPHHHQEPGLHQYHPQEVSHHPQHLQEAVHHPLHLQDVAQQPPAFRQVEGLARQVE